MPADVPEKSLRGICYGADNTPESAAFAEFRRTCLAVMVRLKEALPDEYNLLEQTERAEIRFFWMLRRHRLRRPIAGQGHLWYHLHNSMRAPECVASGMDKGDVNGKTYLYDGVQEA